MRPADFFKSLLVFLHKYVRLGVKGLKSSTTTKCKYYQTSCEMELIDAALNKPMTGCEQSVFVPEIVRATGKVNIMQVVACVQSSRSPQKNRGRDVCVAQSLIVFQYLAVLNLNYRKMEVTARGDRPIRLLCS